MKIKLIQKKWQAITGLKDELNELLGEMQDYYSDKSEKWQESERGEEYQQKIDGLENSINELEQACDTIQDAFELEAE